MFSSTSSFLFISISTTLPFKQSRLAAVADEGIELISEELSPPPHPLFWQRRQ
jgi:peroxiredoxin